MTDEDHKLPAHLEDDVNVVTWSPSFITLEQLRIDPADVVKWLARFSVTGNIADACKHARISRPTIYRMKGDIPEFREAFTRALECAQDTLDREAFRRGVEGVERVIYQGGRNVGTVREYSDKMLAMMLQARHPDYAKTNGSINVTQNQAQGQKIEPIGPPVPDGSDAHGSLGDYIAKLSEVAHKQGILPEPESEAEAEEERMKREDNADTN